MLTQPMICQFIDAMLFNKIMFGIIIGFVLAYGLIKAGQKKGET